MYTYIHFIDNLVVCITVMRSAVVWYDRLSLILKGDVCFY